MRPGELCVYIESLHADDDARRSEVLSRLVFAAARCRVCGAKVQDSGLEEHPGLCWQHARAERRRMRRAQP